MATATYRRFDIKHGISVDGLPFIDENRDVTLNDLTIEGVANLKDYFDVQAQPDGTGDYENNARFQTSSITISAGSSSATVVNTFDKTIYVTAKYLVQIKQSTNYHSAEILLIHDGSDVFMTEYAALWNTSALGTLDAIISGDNVDLTFTPTAATIAADAEVQVKITRISLAD